MTTTKFSKTIRIELIRRDMTQRDLARQLDITYRQLNGFLNGKPSLAIEIKVLEWLKNHD